MIAKGLWTGARHLRRSLTLFLATGLLAACGKSAAPEDGVLRVADQVNVLQSALAAAGEEKPGHYRLQWSNFVGGPGIIAAQTGGSVDLGWMAETPLVFAQAAGSPVKVVAVSKGLRPGSSNIALVVAADSPIRSIDQLKGKKIGYAPGTVTQYLVARLLDDAGLTFDDITSVRAAGFNNAALDKGIVDAFTTAEPMLSQGLQDNTIRVLAYGGEPHTPGYGYLVASEAALADPKRAALIGDFVARTARAARWQRENVAAAAPFTAKAYNVSLDIAEQMLRRTPIRYTPIDASIVAGHQQEADLFHKLGLIRARLDAATLFDNRYDAQIAAAEDTP